MTNTTTTQYASFVESNGPRKHPRSWVAEEYDLAEFAINEGYDDSNGRLTPKDSRALADIPGWTNSIHDRRWLETLWTYQLWMERNGGAHPRMNGVGTTPLERRLGVWASQQRIIFVTETKPTANRRLDRRAILRREIPTLLEHGWLDWEQSLERFRGFLEVHSRKPLASGEVTRAEYRLRKWFDRQRIEYRYDRLGKDRIERLDRDVPGWSNGVDISWDHRLELYRKWVAKNNGCAPTSETDNKLESFLHQWSTRQRELALDGDLSAEQAAAFLAIKVRLVHSLQCEHKNKPRRRH